MILANKVLQRTRHLASAPVNSPLSIMEKIFYFVFVSVLICGCTTRSPQTYFPPDVNQGWYAEYYAALHEKPIWQEAPANTRKEIYRYLSLPTFGNPVLVRIEICEDGRKVATFKKSTGKGGYEPGKLEISKARAISDADFTIFTNLLYEAKYWDLPAKMPVLEPYGKDGSQEIIEVVRNGKYHVVDWWSPDNGPYYLACIHLRRLGFPEDQNPPLSFFRQQYDASALRIAPDQMKKMGGWKTEKETFDAIGSPQCEESDSGGKNAYYRLKNNAYEYLGVRYDKQGVRVRSVMWPEERFSNRMDNKASEAIAPQGVAQPQR